MLVGPSPIAGDLMPELSPALQEWHWFPAGDADPHLPMFSPCGLSPVILPLGFSRTTPNPKIHLVCRTCLARLANPDGPRS